jgi:hypothetical protein
MDFRISGLPLDRFQPLLDLTGDRLADLGVAEVVADEPHAYPCRVTLEDALPGERLLLVPFEHQPAASPYRASGPVFVRRTAAATCHARNAVPDQLRRRLLSVRAYDERDWIVAADVTPGTELESLVERYLGDARVAYLHLHFARPGCYAARVDSA